MSTRSRSLVAVFSALIGGFGFTAMGQDTLPPDVAAGKLIFEETAGGVGCASCHGMDAQGDDGPAIVGAPVDLIIAQFDNNENMTFIELTDEEVQQVAAYLAYLSEQ